MTTTAQHLLITKASAELVEELLINCSKEGGEPWFHIIERKMKRFCNDIRTQAQGAGQQGERAKRARRVIVQGKSAVPKATRRLPVGRK